MDEIKELKKQILDLKQELYETKMIAYGAYESIRSGPMGYKFNLLNPVMLNSKLNWLRVNYWDSHPARYYINDKYMFKYYLSTLIGTEHVVPLYAVYDNAENIRFEELPDQFVIKRTLDGGAAEVKLVDKSKENLESIRALAAKWLSSTTNGRSRVIAEKMLEFEGDKVIDYKFYVCNGIAKLCMCGVMKKEGGHRSYIFYNMNWNRYQLKVSAKTEDVPKPENLKEMIALSEQIGAYFPFIRVDLFSSMGKLYVGELTGLPFNALGPYENYDRIWGSYLKLPTQAEIQKNFEETYELFPELRKHPIFLKGKNPNYRIIQPYDTELPLPPKYFPQPK